MMAQAEVSPDAMRGLLDRLEAFVHPFCASLGAGERRRAAEYLTGLLSHLEHKNAQGIADLLDQDRQPMQRFMGQADWDHRPSLAILAAQVGGRLGEPDGVIVFDPSTFVKEGDKSVGVARKWCGRLGKCHLADRRTRPRSCKVIDGNAVGLGVRSGGVGGLRRPDSPRRRRHSREPLSCKVIRKCWMP
jgi:SRSO17 transposase